MLTPRIVVFTVFVCWLSFLKYTTSEKREDCQKGKQYWSVDILDTGTCAKCPPYWENCDEQPEKDKKSCEQSCRVLKPAKTKPKVQPSPSKVSKITINSNGSLAVVYPSAKLPKHPPEVTEDQKSYVGQEGLGTRGIWIVVGCSFGLIIIFIIVIIVLIVLRRKIRKKLVGHGGLAEDGGMNAGEQGQMVLEPLHPGRDDHLGRIDEHPGRDNEHSLEMHPAVPGRIDERIAIQEEQLSTARIGGIQDTEENNFSSALKLDEKCY